MNWTWLQNIASAARFLLKSEYSRATIKHRRTLIQARRLRAKMGIPRCKATVDTANIVNHVGRRRVFRCVFTVGHELIPNGQDDRPSHLHPEVGSWWSS